MSLSVIIITKNEAHDIRRCLESVRFADEVIVLDSGSTDDTVNICREYTEKVFVTDWPGFGPQKNRALALATGDWVLSLDADEEVPPALREEICQAMTAENAMAAYRMPRLSSYCGHWIRHSGWWPDYITRLFRRGAARFNDNLVHESLQAEGPVGTLKTPLLHYSFKDADEVLDKVNSYSTAGARMLVARGKKATLRQAIAHGLWAFVRTYFLRQGFLDGRAGFMLAVSNAEGTYYRYIKLMQLADPPQ
jgi:glycosyltransferase involved in cell wall biosynthesis